MKLLTFLAAVFVLSTSGCKTVSPSRQVAVLTEFKSDGCTSYPDGTKEDETLWLDHCNAHDRSYWQGGTWKERLEADQELRRGIRSEGKPLAADIAYAGVRLGGSPFLPTPWRWGFGWEEFPRGYGELTAKEKAEVARMMEKE